MVDSKKIVLIVEDEDIVAKMYQGGLKNTTFEVQLARDGEEALTMMKANKPAVVLLDIMMPKLNGIQTLEAIKADAKLKDVHVIMMSNLSSEEDKKQAIDKGAADYWVKRDVQPVELVKRVSEILTKVK